MAHAGVDYLLQDPALSRRVCASLLAPTGDQSHAGFRRTAEHLWIHAMAGEGAPFPPERQDLWARLIPQQLMMSFRGALALWIAEDLPDEHLRAAVNNSVVTILLAFAPPEHGARLIERLLPTE